MTSLTKQKLGALGVLSLVALAGTTLLRSRNDVGSPSAKEPRQVLSRPWFDRLPKSRTDEIDLWFFASSGIGIHERGSVFRATTDFFDFERQGSRLELRFLHDKAKQSVSFELVSCDDKPPFDLCLDVKEPLRERRRFYSFADDDEMNANVPWAREWRRGVEARARAVR
jgi:hypothetical protein